MGIIKRGESGKRSIRAYYDQLKQDAWKGNTRDIRAPHLGRTGRAKHLHGAAVLGGLYLLGQFRSTEPRLYTAAKYAVAPIFGTTVLGKIANTATDILRAGQQLGALPMELTNNYPDIAITNNPLERIKSIFAEPAKSNDVRKKYGLQYATDRSYSDDLGGAGNPDLIPVSFTNNETTIPVRGSISGLSDTVTPTWNETAYVGRPQGVVTYGGFTREMAFDLTLAAVNPGQLRPMWHKINDIMELVLPQADLHNTRFAGRLTEVTIGNYIEGQLCAVTGITVTPNEESYWETMDPDVHHPSLTLNSSVGNKLQSAAKAWIDRTRATKSGETINNIPLSRGKRKILDKDVDYHKYIMPRVVTLNISLKVLHNAIPGSHGNDMFHVNAAPALGKFVPPTL